MAERKGYDLSGYVDVATRIAQFHEKYPEGSLQSELEFMEGGWLCRASAFRSPDDTRPGIGHAFEPVPGKTPYTRDSEAMNAETSAWGRAIVALGFETKNIASAEEVQNRQGSEEVRKEAPTPDSPPKTWAKVNALVPAGKNDLWQAFVRAASYHLYGEQDSKKLTPDQRKVMLQKAAGAAMWATENENTPMGSTWSVEQLKAAWATVLSGAVLESPEFVEPDDEVERLARIAEDTLTGPPA